MQYFNIESNALDTQINHFYIRGEICLDALTGLIKQLVNYMNKHM